MFPPWCIKPRACSCNKHQCTFGLHQLIQRHGNRHLELEGIFVINVRCRIRHDVHYWHSLGRQKLCNMSWNCGGCPVFLMSCRMKRMRSSFSSEKMADGATTSAALQRRHSARLCPPTCVNRHNSIIHAEGREGSTAREALFGYQ